MRPADYTSAVRLIISSLGKGVVDIALKVSVYSPVLCDLCEVENVELVRLNHLGDQGTSTN